MILKLKKIHNQPIHRKKRQILRQNPENSPKHKVIPWRLRMAKAAGLCLFWGQYRQNPK